MKLLSKIKSESLPIQVAIYSFIGVTILFFSCALIALQTDLMILVAVCIFTLIFINAITALVLFFKIVSSSTLRNERIYELLIILANIPIAALYIFIIYNQEQLF